MYFESNYIIFDDKLDLNTAIYNKNIMSKFINKYLLAYPDDYYNAVVYSKYHLYYKLFNCTYDSDIMIIIETI